MPEFAEVVRSLRDDYDDRRPPDRPQHGARDGRLRPDPRARPGPHARRGRAGGDPRATSTSRPPTWARPPSTPTMPDAGPRARRRRGALRQRRRRARRAAAGRRGRDRRPDRPERRGQVDHAPRDHGRRAAARPARSGYAAARCGGSAPSRSRTPASRSCRRAGGSSPSSRWRRTSASGSRLVAGTAAAIRSRLAYDLFPVLKEFRRRKAGAPLGRPAAAARDRPRARGRAGRCCCSTSRRSAWRRSPSTASSRRCAGSASAASRSCSSSSARSTRWPSPTARTCSSAASSADARPRRRPRHRQDRRRLPRLVIILGTLDFQTLSDAVGLGAIYALMAVGIGLVFGVLRLVNFAYGQLIMAGAYTLAFTRRAGRPGRASWPASPWSSRSRSRWTRWSSGRCAARLAAVMLVTTFAIAFLLQAVALIVDVRDGTIGEVAPSLGLAERGGHDRRHRRPQDHARRDRRRGGGAAAARRCC